MKSRIMYIESKGDGLTGPARIGRVTFSKSGATVCYLKIRGRPVPAKHVRRAVLSMTNGIERQENG